MVKSQREREIEKDRDKGTYCERQRCGGGGERNIKEKYKNIKNQSERFWRRDRGREKNDRHRGKKSEILRNIEIEVHIVKGRGGGGEQKIKALRR